MTKLRRVVIVDGNELTRVGTDLLLTGDSRIRVIGAFDSETATHRSDWTGVDVLLIDPADERNTRDQFPGVEVIRRLRAASLEAQPVVVALTGHPRDQALLRRMWEAGADYLYSRAEIATAGRLSAVVLAPEECARLASPRPDPRLAGLGIGPETRVNDFVAAVHDAGLDAVLGPDVRMKNAPRPARSRWWHQVRADLARAGQLRAVNADGTSPRRDQRTPSIAQLRRCYEWATRIKPPRGLT